MQRAASSATGTPNPRRTALSLAVRGLSPVLSRIFRFGRRQGSPIVSEASLCVSAGSARPRRWALQAPTRLWALRDNPFV
ncbi:hypothetical protein RGR602_PC02057 (plasmid) [Rhizobium gallicum bv. gallicum R602sp]|uniref:Uncharacterized protein n=1 Tax=Rhizobium gallicum bv. gallicum R602sp TaxID=1041138 RepID=A0A0B4XH60_9HYPH|nr:hypothetical protein RGR602_PC02057 [Rhizobium gallicum bv. gallicum R602sp]